MTITEHPEFKTIMEEAYNKAYLHGVEDERERCAKIADAVGDYESALEFRSGHNGDMPTSLSARNRKHAAQFVAEKIRSGQ